MAYSSGISTGTIVALVLNIILREDKNEKNINQKLDSEAI